jgi:hypothetical protein
MNENDENFRWKSNKLEWRIFTRVEIDKRVEYAINHIIYSNFKSDSQISLIIFLCFFYCLEKCFKQRYFIEKSRVAHREESEYCFMNRGRYSQVLWEVLMYETLMMKISGNWIIEKFE